jgi:hypothetical protein
MSQLAGDRWLGTRDASRSYLLDGREHRFEQLALRAQGHSHRTEKNDFSRKGFQTMKLSSARH